MLADLYLGQNQFDLALQHRQEALKGLEKRLTSGKNALKNIKDRDAALKHYYDANIDWLDKTVRVRLAHFKENSDTLKPLEKVGQALNMPFKELGDKGEIASPLGLANKAWDLLM